MKIFFYALREFDELDYCREFSQKYGIEFGYCTEYPNMENAALAAGYDAVSATPCDMGERMLKRFSQLGVKYITCRSIGYDHVDLNAARNLGMRVSNVTYPPNGVANYAIMLMLMCLRKMPHILKRSEVQDYSLKSKLGRDISGCTVGVIGTGKIGETVIRHLHGFGCKIVAYDVYKKDNLKGLAGYVCLDELFARSDVITLHANATEENYHIICDSSIQKMKDGVCIVNTARGKLIDSSALIKGLENGKIGSAALDVLEDENGLYYYNRAGEVIANRDMAVLRSFPNVIIAPHTAFYTEDDVSDMVEDCFESLYCFENNMETFHEIKL